MKLLCAGLRYSNSYFIDASGHLYMSFLLPEKTLPCPLRTSPPLSSVKFFQDLASLRRLFSDLLTCFLALFPHHGANHMNCVACLSSVSFTRLAALWMGTLSLITEFLASSNVLAWRIPGTGEPGGLPSMGSHRVGHDWSDLAVAVLSKFSPYQTGESITSWKHIFKHFIYKI